MVIRVLGLYTIISLLISAQTALAATPPKFAQRQLKGSLITEYYTTDSNYDREGGSFESLANSNKLTYIAAKPSLTYGLSKKWALSGGFTYAFAKSEGAFFDTSKGGLEDIDRTNGAVTDAETGLYYKMVTRSFYLLPQLRVSVPIATVDPNSDEAIINEGAVKVELGAWIEKKFWSHRFYAYAGYTYQGDGRAHLIPYELGMYNTIGRFLYGGSIWGHEIATDDEFIDSPEQRSNRTDQVNAGSLKFYSVNPKILNAKAWVGTRLFRDFLFYLKYEKSINGSNSANGQSILAEIRWRIIDPRKSHRQRRKNKFKIIGVDEKEQKLLDATSDSK